MRVAQLDILEKEVTKVYIQENKVVAFDTQLFHIRLDNMAKSKSMDSLMKRLTTKFLDGTLTITVEMED